MSSEDADLLQQQNVVLKEALDAARHELQDANKQASMCYVVDACALAWCELSHPAAIVSHSHCAQMPGLASKDGGGGAQPAVT